MKEIFDRLARDFDHQEEEREHLIVSSRPLLSGAKKLINSLHRDEQTDELAAELRALCRDLQKTDASNLPSAYHAAMQEYTEAMLYEGYVKSGGLVDPSVLGVTAEDYLMGLCDLTGELARRAVLKVARGESEEIPKLHAFIDEVHRHLSEYSFRNGEIRRKYDAVKWNLKKVEEVLYDVRMRESR